MAQDIDLIALGMPAPLASLEGVQNSSVTAAGTTQGTATALTTEQTGVNLTTAGGADSVKLPLALGWRPYYISVQTATTGQVFPPSGHSINAAGADTAVTITQNLARVFIRVSGTHWISFVAA